MRTRAFVIAAALAVILGLFPVSAGVCDSYIHLNSGEAYRCGNEFWTEGMDIFYGWLWITPGTGGVQAASFRIAQCANLIHISTAYGPGISVFGDIYGDGCDIAVDPCRTEPFFVSRLTWFNLSTDYCYLTPEATAGGDFLDVTCAGATGYLLADGYLSFNMYACLCGGTPVPSTCHQIEPDRLRVVFRSPPAKIDCGEDHVYFSIIEKAGPLEYPDTLDVVEAVFDSFNCHYCNMCDSIVAVFTFDEPLDNARNYVFNIDGFGSECCSCGGKRFFPIERLIPVATMLKEFSAGLVPEGIEVRWSLSAMDDAAAFHIERSRDGSGFAGVRENQESEGDGSYVFVDGDVLPGSGYAYRIIVEDAEGSRTLFETGRIDVPSAPLTLSNHPNPFNPATEIEFSLPEGGRAVLLIYDVGGKLVRRLVDRNMEAGAHSVVWKGLDDAGYAMPSGIYFCRLGLGKAEVTSKLVLLR